MTDELESAAKDPEPSQNAAIVFIFPLPEKDDLLGIQKILGPAREFFHDVKDMKVYAAIREAAEEVSDIFDPEIRSGSLIDHALRELQYAGNDEDFNRSIIRAIKGFTSYGHSGGSASVGIHILHELLQWKNLTPLTDNPKEWMNVSDATGEEIWQSVRNSEAFSSDGGKTYYLLSEGANATKQEPLHISEPYTESDDKDEKEGE